MKKIISAVLLLIFVLSLVGCDNQSGLTDDTNNSAESTSSAVTEATVIEDAGRIYKLENNVLYGKGANYEGILGEKEHYDEWVKIAENVKMFDACTAALLYLTTDGKVYGMGDKEGGVLQIRTDYEDRDGEVTEPVLLFDDCKSISLGCRFALALKNDNSVWFWGESLNCQSTEIVDQIITPTKIVEEAKMIKAIMCTSAWIDPDGTLYMCGDNSSGQIGNGKKGTGFPQLLEDIVEVPYPVLDRCVNVYCSEDMRFVYADTDDGSTYVWGGNKYTTPTNIKNTDEYKSKADVS